MYKIRSAHANDLSRMTEIGTDNGLDVTEESLGSAYLDDWRRLVVAEYDGEVLGFIDVLLSGKEAEIVDVAVDVRCHRIGIGSGLVENIQDSMLGRIAEGEARMFLEVRADNEEAIAFYKKMGFSASGRRPNYYRDGEDALIMSWSARPYAFDLKGQRR